ncbi:hypothetical protein HN51_003198 [Arachis hypogaea]|uniref:RRM domain-containing protein n=1 Tax=Arachis hypogaea TaxID=3818 RepID=A0A445EJK4_ARAHY|nr:glycine-rich RNA-binding protein 3, mitochondrial [Arachis hypogaea]QHO51540.1 Glycine-rich RNA-binding protein 3 [Arachis hypogaea]RYR75640.1 hypothetical protein Ahy_A01g000213 [Arachis hypogaea]
MLHFFGRIGNLLRNAANKQISSELLSSPSYFQAIRCMSSAPSSKLFIGGVSYSTDEQGLREAFSRYGEVVDARIIVDRDSGRSRGFGFVTFSSAEEASSAIQALDGQDLHGRRIRVNYANERPRGFGGGGGGFGGSYGNAPYGAGAGYGSAYGNSPYDGAPGGGGGGYGGNAAGGYGGGGYGSGGNYGRSGYDNNYSTPDSFGSSSAGGSGDYGGNSGNFGVAAGGGGSDSYGSAPGFDAAAGVGSHETSAGFGGSDNYASAGGFDGSEGSGYGSSGQLDNKETSIEGEDMDLVEGNYKDDNDDTDDFAKRA